MLAADYPAKLLSLNLPYPSSVSHLSHERVGVACDRLGSSGRVPPEEFCDSATWPQYLLAVLLEKGFRSATRQRRRLLARMARASYYSLDVVSKLSVLAFLCDEALLSLRVRFEMDRRELELGPEEVDADTAPAPQDGESEPALTPSNEAHPASAGATPDAHAGEAALSGAGDGDGNADDCKLCGMDGNLICCDGCPCSFHARCVGVTAALLPSGPWFCPECAMERTAADCAARPTAVGLRVPSAGVDRYLRSYWVLFSRALV